MRLLVSNGTPSAVVGPCDGCCSPPSPSAVAESRPTVSLPSASPPAMAVEDIVVESTVAVAATIYWSGEINSEFSLSSVLFAAPALFSCFDEARLAWRCRLAGRKFRAPKRPRVAVMREATNARRVTNLSKLHLSLLSFPETPVEGLYLIWINSFALFSAIGSVRVASHFYFIRDRHFLPSFNRPAGCALLHYRPRPLLHQPRCRKLIHHVLPCGVPVPSPLPLPPDFAACSSIPRWLAYLPLHRRCLQR